jgi:large subunit ribosomal protein L25
MARLIMASDTTSLSLSARSPEGSRSARRLRREGLVPGVIYGEGGDPQHFAVDARILRNTLARSGAILDVTIDGGTGTPVLVKDLQRHPVRGEAIHVDFLRVNMAETIHTTVVLELTGAEDSPGVDEGGVLNQETRELNIEALPGDIPDSIVPTSSKKPSNPAGLITHMRRPAVWPR